MGLWPKYRGGSTPLRRERVHWRFPFPEPICDPAKNPRDTGIPRSGGDEGPGFAGAMISGKSRYFAANSSLYFPYPSAVNSDLGMNRNAAEFMQ